MIARPAATAAVFALALGGCAAPVLRGLGTEAAVELTATPFFPQTEHQCGPAALATVLSASGVTLSTDQLAAQVLLPDRHGSLQLELVAAVRRNGRLPLRLKPELEALRAALRAGYPVLVLQNLGLDRWPRWHYAVVVGIDPVHDRVILRSGTTRREEMSARRFLATWERADRWALAVAGLTAPPPFAEARSWLEAVSGLEQTAGSRMALPAYSAAVGRWPDEPLAWQALGNARYAVSDRIGAVAAYRHALTLRPMAETYNNLAHALGELGCVDAARALVAEGLAHAGARHHPVLEQTRAELGERAPADCPL